jgi:predicted permease
MMGKRHMFHMAHDFRFALRALRKSPVFSAVAILSLALGIGANTAIFTLVDQLILNLLPVEEPDRLVLLVGGGRHYGSDMGRNPLSYPMFEDIRDHNPVFSGVMCRYRVNPSVGVGTETVVVGGELVSGNYFPLLGIQPAAGRLFTADDDIPLGAHPYAVLSYGWWQSRFAGDPGVIGRTIRVNGYPVTIVGVSQRGFDGMEPGVPASIFVALNVAPAVRPGFMDMLNRRHRWVTVYGRLKAGVSVEQARAGLQPLFHQILESEVVEPAFRNATAFDKDQFLKMSLRVLPGSQGNSMLRNQYERALWMLMGVVGLVLLIACANLASLLTARAASRRKEIAIRLAVGCSRFRMVQELLVESLILAAGGSIAGIGLAVFMVKGLLRFLPANIAGYAISSSPDYRVLGFTLLLCLITGIGFGLVPALQSTKPELAQALKDEAGITLGSGAQLNFRKLAVAAQVALCLVLLVGAGLFLRSLANLRSIDPGFRTSNIIQFSMAPGSAGYDANRTGAFYRSLEERLQSLPGVHSAGLAGMAVLTATGFDRSITVEGYRAVRGEVMKPHFDVVSPGYFETMGMHVLAGRNFTLKDDSTAPPVVVVNARFVTKYFGNRLSIGRHIGMGTDPGTPTDIEIVGVVNDSRYESLRSEVVPEVYLCTLQQQRNGSVVYVRTEGNPDGAQRAIRSAVQELGPGLPIFELKTLDRQVDESLVTERMIATLSTVFGILATALAILGLYGVTAYTVARRSREIGIRMALGAQGGTVVGLVMREMLVLVLTGVIVGLPCAAALSRIARTQLYGVSPNDFLSMALATLLLTAVTLIAAYIPARRAVRCDPVRILRAE